MHEDRNATRFRELEQRLIPRVPEVAAVAATRHGDAGEAQHVDGPPRFREGVDDVVAGNSREGAEAIRRLRDDRGELIVRGLCEAARGRSSRPITRQYRK